MAMVVAHAHTAHFDKMRVMILPLQIEHGS